MKKDAPYTIIIEYVSREQLPPETLIRMEAAQKALRSDVGRLICESLKKQGEES